MNKILARVPSSARASLAAVGLSVALALSGAAAHAAQVASLNVNLLQNGGAEKGAASSNGSTLVPIPKWGSGGAAVVVSYSLGGGFPGVDSPGSANRGLQFFAGGQNNEQSAITQRVDLSPLLMDIDGGSLTFVLQAWLGGFSSQQDNASLKVEFFDAAGVRLSSGVLPAVTAEERGGVTGMLLRKTTGAVPIGTRSVKATLVMRRLAGSYNDGYADGLSLVLKLAQP